MEKVIWRVPGLFKANPEKVDAEIRTLGDEFKPADLVDYAREHKGSELHKCFEWDDSIAAEKYRIQQAQKVIQTLIITTSEKEDVPPVRKFSKTPEENIYSETRIIFMNPDAYENLLKQAIDELKALERKYQTLTELDAVFAAIDEL